MNLNDIKNTWKEYGDLLKTIAAVVTIIFSGIATASGFIIHKIVKDTIAADVGTTEAVMNLASSVKVLNSTAKNLDASVKRLDSTVATLQGDVTDIHMHLAGIRPAGMTRGQGDN